MAAIPLQTARTAVLDDGRRISWAEYGSPSGAPLVLVHGIPGSRLQWQHLHEPAAAAGVRVVAPERPGYGRSDPVPGGVTFTRYADDSANSSITSNCRQSRCPGPVVEPDSPWPLPSHIRSAFGGCS